MANTPTVTKVMDGQRNAVFHIYIRGDGVSGDLSKYVIIDPLLDLDPSQKRKPTFTITDLWYSLSGFDARLEFDYLNDETGIWALAPGNATQLNFDVFGGLKDRSNELDGTGKILLSTSNLISANCCGSIIIKVRKD